MVANRNLFLSKIRIREDEHQLFMTGLEAREWIDDKNIGISEYVRTALREKVARDIEELEKIKQAEGWE